MFLKSKYRVEFSKSKEEILENIKDSIFRGFPDFFGKSFKGKVTENGFKVRLMEKDFQTFKGEFIIDKDNKYSLELFIGLEFYQILIPFIFTCCFSFIIFKNFYGDVYFSTVYLVVVAIIIYTNYSGSKKGKELFFEYLTNFDKDCKVVLIK
jgi:hypothetical protein